jgi:uncharacterized repeat protein (TIGR03803 family)
MNRNVDESAIGLREAITRRRASRKFGAGLACFALALAGGNRSWADWTPPESSVTPPAVVTLDAFAAPDANGGGTPSTLVLGSDGALYGSTPTGGGIGNLLTDGHSIGYGTLFRLETNGIFTKLHDFNGTAGSKPSAALTLGPDGALYGSTSDILFRLGTDVTFTQLYDFGSRINGYEPLAPLVVGPDGALYGSTEYGGTSDAGMLFRLETNGTFTKLHDFDSSTDGGSTGSAGGRAGWRVVRLDPARRDWWQGDVVPVADGWHLHKTP